MASTFPVQAYRNVKHAWLLDWYMSDIDQWSLTTAPFAITYNGLTYIASRLPTNVGRLADSIKAGDYQLAVTFSGVDISFKQAALSTNLTGRPFNAYRVYFDESYNQLAIQKRYSGLITSVSFDDDYPITPDGDKRASFSVLFQVTSIKQILQNRVAGRYTSQSSMQQFFPLDTSMNQVAAERDREIVLGRVS